MMNMVHDVVQIKDYSKSASFTLSYLVYDK